MICIDNTSSVLCHFNDRPALDFDVLWSSRCLVDGRADAVPLNQRNHDTSDLGRLDQNVLAGIDHGKLIWVLHEERRFDDAWCDCSDTDADLVDLGHRPHESTNRMFCCIINRRRETGVLGVCARDYDNRPRLLFVSQETRQRQLSGPDRMNQVDVDTGIATAVEGIFALWGSRRIPKAAKALYNYWISGS